MKRYEELQLCDDFLFFQVMQNEEVCKEILEIILGKKVREVHICTQKEFKPTYESRGIRLDVYLVGDEKRYVIEMQNYYDEYLPQRSRYYQGVIDVDMLMSGVKVASLSRSYVIFICTYPLFDGKRHIYAFQNTCRDNPDLTLEDGTVKIFLTTKAEEDDCSKELLDFLRLVEDIDARTDSESEMIENLRSHVMRIKKNHELEVEYMTFETRMEHQYDEGMKAGEERGILEGKEEGIQIGEERGMQQGESRLSMLISHLLNNAGGNQKIERAINDEDYRKELYRELGI